MTARIAGFVTRAQCGLRGPKSVSRNITPSRGGVGVHYGGPRQSAADPGADHARCIATWRSWQLYHMNTKGWSDIAYTGGFCNHGFAFAGRGAGVRTAANGTNDGNQRFYAITWIGGEGQTPTQEALDAADWWIATLRSQGAGRQVKPHRFFKSTGCPGNPLVEYAASRDGQADLGNVAPVPPSPAPPSSKYSPEGNGLLKRYVHGPRTKQVQQKLGIEADGYFGDGTHAAVAAYQAKHRLAVDGIVGDQTWRHMFPPAPPKPVAPAFPLPAGHYFGPKSGPKESVSGYYSHRNDLRRWQQQMIARGWNLGRAGADGLWGNDTERVARAFQAEKRLTVDGRVGPQTWAAAWTAPRT